MLNSFKAQRTSVAIPAGRALLCGRLHQTAEAVGLVVFADIGGNHRNTKHDNRLADALHDVALATLTLELLPETAELGNVFDGGLRNNIPLLAERLRAAARWTRDQADLADLPLGFFGTGNGALACLVAATDARLGIQAIVTRGARPGPTDVSVEKLRVPTMLIVGGNDETAAALNLEMWARLRCEKVIEIIPGVGPLFEEPGALDNVAALAARWFDEHMRAVSNVLA